jgi:hypothetical protein
MNQGPADEIVRRLLVAKQVLGTPGSLTPHSDPITVAQAILAAHDAAELAAATIATAVGAEITEKSTLMDYPAAIVRRVSVPAVFPGRDYLGLVNRARREFKHAGILPNPADWFRVTENVSGRIAEWCTVYLDLNFETLSAYELLVNSDARELYKKAEEAHQEGRYKEALEFLAAALAHALIAVPRIGFTVVGESNAHEALLLTAFGVSASEYLTLQEFLPFAWIGVGGNIEIRWETRKRGHPANWTRAKVAFCLSAFLNVALKIQHAPDMPRAVPFHWVYDDVITARDEPVELWHYVYEGQSILSRRPVGRKPVLRLEPGVPFRCRLAVSPHDESVSLSDLARGGRKSVESASVLQVQSPILTDGVAYVDRDKVDLSFEVKDEPFARSIASED